MSANHHDPPEPLLTDLLRAVSRSFYLTLRVLPAKVRQPISLAYLLARTSDTIADTDVLPASQRLESLQSLLEAVTSEDALACNFDAFLSHQSRSKEKTLLQRVNEGLTLLRQTPTPDRTLIVTVLRTIISGQQLDLERFQSANSQSPVCLATPDELDDYTFRVAGCVGEFWTRICYQHLAPKEPTASDKQIEQSIRFGKGLQLVNILRDFPEDLEQGRCYLPLSELQAQQMAPTSLRLPSNESKLAHLFRQHIRVAREHLNAGWDYTCALPWTWPRVRLACAWPILLGFQTLDLLPLDHPLSATSPAKVTRSQVKRTMVQTLITYPVPLLWNRLGTKYR